jgi:hypothetical protein
MAIRAVASRAVAAVLLLAVASAVAGEVFFQEKFEGDSARSSPPSSPPLLLAIWLSALFSWIVLDLVGDRAGGYGCYFVRICGVLAFLLGFSNALGL